MDLIEYDDSSDEEFRQVQNNTCNNYLEVNNSTNQNQSLFSSVPPDEDQQDKEVDELLVKKTNKRIQINIPSLTDYNEEIEGPADKITKKSVLALAQKALANNKELQMRWSENRFKRKQTQAKYGF
ncbi:hypothetical protein FQR65_LT02799 [Abscondita terminalis]|nr:hypothetical protein FQR65_LT02799 [Abscondita terminalis]